MTFLDRAAATYALEYFGLVIVITLLEWGFPRRRAGESLSLRWFGNFGVAVLDAVVLRLLIPLTGVALAVICQRRGWGVLNLVELPSAVTVPLAVLVLDLNAYLVHVLSHRVPWLWTLHRMHHTDQDFDFTTGIRFHPLDGIFTTLVGLLVIAALGAPPIGVWLFQALTVASAFFEHSNVRIPRSIERGLRLVIVTPEVHRIHHSNVRAEAQSNLGSIFPWWDRLFGTYLSEPAAGEGMAFGVSGFSDRKYLRLGWMLWTPFVRRQPAAAAAVRWRSRGRARRAGAD
jgi:sterol desaturase/sphingolipid hydroxylase (fatty acid hydroxylase superfamily)